MKTRYIADTVKYTEIDPLIDGASFFSDEYFVREGDLRLINAHPHFAFEVRQDGWFFQPKRIFWRPYNKE